MNFLNNAIAQVSDLFRSMTPGARVTAVLLLAVVVVSFGYLFRQGTAGPDAYLFGGEPLSDGELDNIETALGKAGLSGFEREGNRLRVPGGQKAAYLGAIADAGVQPANFNTILEKALNTSKMWDSREQARERIKDARQRQLSEIVRAMNWVEEAVVLYDEQEARGLSPKKKVTASVNVQPKMGHVVDAQKRAMLRKFVASAIVGLDPNDVTVTDLASGSAGAGGGGIDAAMFDDPFYQRKVAFEQYMREKIENVLDTIPGVIVEVNAELDDTASKSTTSAKRDAKNSVAVRETEASEKSVKSAADGGGEPGPRSQGPNPTNVAAAPQRQNQDERSSSKTNTESLPGFDSEVVTTQGFTPKDVLATVMIPTKYFETVWRNQNRAATDPPKPEELKVVESEVTAKVVKMVEQLLVKTADQLRDTRQRVAVVALDAPPAPVIEPPSIASKALAWSGQYWNTLAMLGVAMFSLMVLRSVVKGGPPSVAKQETPPVVLAHNTTEATPASEAPDAEPSDGRPKLKLKKGTSVKDDLVEIVREDPDAAADILRSWIGKAA